MFLFGPEKTQIIFWEGGSERAEAPPGAKVQLKGVHTASSTPMLQHMGAVASELGGRTAGVLGKPREVS